MFAQSSSQGSYPPMQSFGHAQPHGIQGVDVNSPEVFKQNMQSIGQQIAQVQNLIQSILLGIQNAYHPGNTPTQAEADIATLKQLVQLLIEMLRQSGLATFQCTLLLKPKFPTNNNLWLLRRDRSMRYINDKTVCNKVLRYLLIGWTHSELIWGVRDCGCSSSVLKFYIRCNLHCFGGRLTDPGLVGRKFRVYNSKQDDEAPTSQIGIYLATLAAANTSTCSAITVFPNKLEGDKLIPLAESRSFDVTLVDANASMSTLAYVEIPGSATRLRSPGGAVRHELRPAYKEVIPLPSPSPPPSPTRDRDRSNSVVNPLSPTFSLLPQMLLSSVIPPGATTSTSNSTSSSAGGGSLKTNPARDKTSGDAPVLLSNKDPLSIPTTTNNFKRFVARVGPVFWVQDRIEEVLFWRRGWKVTGVWMVFYTLLCFYPRFIFVLPHIAGIAVILATYPYAASPHDSPPAQATEGSIPWQANLQAIQNLMGFVSDAHAEILPYTQHVVLPPLPAPSPTASRSPPSSPTPGSTFSFSPRPGSSSSTASNSNIQEVSTLRTSYAPHILTLLVLTFPPTLFVVSNPYFPIRLVCLVGGLAPFVATNPHMQLYAPYLFKNVLIPLIEHSWRKLVVWVSTYQLPPPVRHILKLFSSKTRPSPTSAASAKETFLGSLVTPPTTSPVTTLKVVLQRIVDNDHLPDECWNAEMKEVELWENERYLGTTRSASPTFSSMGDGIGFSDGLTIPSEADDVVGWSKTNLKPGERMAWTRGRDGWSPVGSASTSGNGNNGSVWGSGSSGTRNSVIGDGLKRISSRSSTIPGLGSDSQLEGEVSSNLTFSIAPGWSFVQTEDWRKDLGAGWAEDSGGGDEGLWMGVH
ncbi:hypothetical protein BDN72DRAFT_861568 [Pluteus cervinus]|uniref:Uncharacterized protein n=1 Tax=Pluteus cervinus TaxID=181527 RepID=A0ACD3AE67_9AGAR|nr:hypothetical protein BDN72DRAFT_861568 [Pluteus cervinus]